MSKSTITSKGQVTLPIEVRTQLGLKQGDQLEFEVKGEQLSVVITRRRSASELRGVLAGGPRYISREAEREAAAEGLAEKYAGRNT